MATTEQINILKLMGCTEHQVAVGDNVYYRVRYIDSHGERWQTHLSLSEHMVWNEAWGAISRDRCRDFLLRCHEYQTNQLT